MKMPTFEEEAMQQMMDWDEEARYAAVLQHRREASERAARVRKTVLERRAASKSRQQKLLAAVLAAAASGERNREAETALAEAGAGRKAVEELVQTVLETNRMVEGE